MQEKKLLVLDVEGTIITAYDSNIEVEDRYAAIIDKKLRDVLKNFSDAGFEIVLATGTEGDNLDYYEREFEKADIAKFINKYSPDNHSGDDSKVVKLTKYAQEFNISDKQNIYFFDDAEHNVVDTRNSGFLNSFQVTAQNTLVAQLSELSDRLGLKKVGSFPSTVTMFPPKPSTKSESDPLLEPESKEKDCCSPCNIL
jgi:HAD superfamily phosphatase (TIGR01681 family)